VTVALVALLAGLGAVGALVRNLLRDPAAEHAAAA
jgi:hypothetical protein